MTEVQIALVKQSWSFFRKLDPVLVGDVFYGKLFIMAPELKTMFHISMEEQSRKIVEMLSQIVSHLHHLDQLGEDITQLAQRHVQYGVKAHHYNTVSIALLWTLQHGLGRDWNEQVKEAWETCFNALSESMIKASGYSTKSY